MAEQEVAIQEHKRLFQAKLDEELARQASADEEGRSQFLSADKHARVCDVVHQWDALDAAGRKQLQKQDGFGQAYAWSKKYALVSAGATQVLVFKSGEPEKEGEAPAALDAALVVSHQGRCFEDLRGVHVAKGHAKSKSFERAVKEKFGKSIPGWVCIAFTDTCPTCVRKLPRKPDSAGHQPLGARRRG